MGFKNILIINSLKYILFPETSQKFYVWCVVGISLVILFPLIDSQLPQGYF